jgi:hypothetical protein
MCKDRKQMTEVRLIVIVLVDLTDPTLTEALAAPGPKPSSLAEVVSSEVVANLESVAYIEAVIVSPL